MSRVENNRTWPHQFIHHQWWLPVNGEHAGAKHISLLFLSLPCSSGSCSRHLFHHITLSHNIGICRCCGQCRAIYMPRLRIKQYHWCLAALVWNSRAASMSGRKSGHIFIGDASRQYFLILSSGQAFFRRYRPSPRWPWHEYDADLNQWNRNAINSLPWHTHCLLKLHFPPPDYVGGDHEIPLYVGTREAPWYCGAYHHLRTDAWRPSTTIVLVAWPLLLIIELLFVLNNFTAYFTESRHCARPAHLMIPPQYRLRSSGHI